MKFLDRAGTEALLKTGTEHSFTLTHLAMGNLFELKNLRSDRPEDAAPKASLTSCRCVEIWRSMPCLKVVLRAHDCCQTLIVNYFCELNARTGAIAAMGLSA
ncbi:MAG: hypothetical protein ACP5D7_24430 [Limnospira sp.]